MFDQYATEIAHIVAKVVELFGIGIIAFGAFGTPGFVSRMISRDRAVPTASSAAFWFRT